MNRIEKILMRRDGETETEAKAIVEESRERFYNGEDPEEILNDLGLEPDYVFDLF